MKFNVVEFITPVLDNKGESHVLPPIYWTTLLHRTLIEVLLFTLNLS